MCVCENQSYIIHCHNSGAVDTAVVYSLKEKRKNVYRWCFKFKLNEKFSAVTLWSEVWSELKKEWEMMMCSRGRKRNQWFRTRCWGCCSYSCGSERSTSSRLLFLMVQVHKWYIQCLQTAVHTHTHTNSFVCFFKRKGLVFCANISPVLCVLQWISGIFLFSMLLSWQFKLDILATCISFMMCFWLQVKRERWSTEGTTLTEGNMWSIPAVVSFLKAILWELQVRSRPWTEGVVRWI